MQCCNQMKCLIRIGYGRIRCTVLSWLGFFFRFFLWAIWGFFCQQDLDKPVCIGSIAFRWDGVMFKSWGRLKTFFPLLPSSEGSRDPVLHQLSSGRVLATRGFSCPVFYFVLSPAGCYFGNRLWVFQKGEHSFMPLPGNDVVHQSRQPTSLNDQVVFR